MELDERHSQLRCDSDRLLPSVNIVYQLYEQVQPCQLSLTGIIFGQPRRILINSAFDSAIERVFVRRNILPSTLIFFILFQIHDADVPFSQTGYRTTRKK